MTSDSARRYTDGNKSPSHAPTARLGRIIRFLAALGLVGAFVHIGCGTVGDNEETVEKQGALGAFGNWNQIGSTANLLQDAPALARVSTTWTAFGLATSGEILTNRQDGSGQWGSWGQLSNNGGPFTGRPAVVGFNVSSGPLFNRFALIARRADNQYYIRIQDQTGAAVLQDWIPIGTGIYASAPAVAFVPQGSITAPKNTLVVVGRGLDDRFWESRNTLGTGNTYSQSSWSGPNAPFGNQTFDSAPTLTYTCPPFSGQASLAVAGRSNQMFLVSTYTGTAWTSFTTMQNGTFNSGPALATGCAEFSNEITIYGRGMDNLTYVSTYVPGSNGNFQPIGTTRFVGTPMAAGFSNFTNAAALNRGSGGGSGTPYMNTAVSP